jgi:tRNA pseudouridine38-40 synthase
MAKEISQVKNIRLILSYEGTRYRGWQRQKEGPTIQGILEDTILRITGERVSLIASGRTDSGVHALHQVCNFVVRTRMIPETMKRALNALLPDDILIQGVDEVPLMFHSRHHAVKKTYEYRILNRNLPDVFQRRYCWHIPRELDVQRMGACLAFLVGENDFSSFMSSGSGNVNPVRDMMRAELHEHSEGILCLLFEANGFLRHMVRNIVGTIVDAGMGSIGVVEFRDIFQARNRRLAGVKAPPHGLFLKMVNY